MLSALIGIAVTIWQAGLFRVAAWFSRGLRVPSRNALLADMVPAHVYGRAYGFERAMDNLGAICGPLLALGLVSILGVRLALLLSVIPGLLAALAILYALRHLPKASTRERQPMRLHLRLVLRGRLGRLLIGVGFFEIGHIAATLLILRATQLLTPGLGLNAATQVALGLYTAYNVAATGASFPAGRLGDRQSTTLVFAVGVGFFLLAYLGFAVPSSNILLLALGFVAAGIAIGCVETSQHTAVASLAPADTRGSAFGVLAAIQSFGNIVASAVAGLLWSVFSPTVAFLYLAAWTFIALVVLVSLAIGRTHRSLA